jgi:hypothetical protein
MIKNKFENLIFQKKILVFEEMKGRGALGPRGRMHFYK